MAASPCRAIFVDDHSLFRRGLVGLMRNDGRVEVVGEAADGNTAIEVAGTTVPDAIVMDLHMPVCGGVEATQRLREGGFVGGILILTVSDKDDDLYAALRAGANGYVLKDAELEELVGAMLQAARGGVVVSPALASAIVSGIGRRSQSGADTDEIEDASLSEREREVLCFVAQGLGTRAIAEKLYVSENTIKSHLRNMLAKLGLQSRYELVSYAARMGYGDNST